MRDPQFRQQQADDLRAPHVAPVNALVDELINPAGRGWVPYVASLYGGVNARVLNIHRDPGPKTRSQHGGSGFLCLENDDATAERFAALLDGAGMPWVKRWPGTPIPGTSTARREQPNWRPVSSRYGSYSVSSPGCGWLCCTEDQPGTAGDGWHDGIPAWYSDSKSCPPTTPATRHSSARPRSGQHA